MDATTNAHTKSSRWRRLAASRWPEGVVVSVPALLGVLCFALAYASLLGVDPYVVIALVCALFVVMLWWLQVLRVAVPLVPRAGETSRGNPYGLGLWSAAGLSLLAGGLLCLFSLAFLLRPASLVALLGLALMLAGVVALPVQWVYLMHCHGRMATGSVAHPRLALAFSVPVLVATVGLVAWTVANVPAFLPDYTLGSHVQADALAWSANGRYLAVKRGNGAVAVWDVAARREVWQAPCVNGVGDVVWSPDSAYLAATCENPESTGAAPNFSVTIWSGTLTTATPVQTIDVGGYPFSGLFTWSPDSAQLAVLRSPQSINAVDLYRTSDWTRARTLKIGAAALDLAWSPDGRYLALAESPVVVVSVATGQQVAELDGTVGVASRLLWSPNSALLAVLGSRGESISVSTGSIDVWQVMTSTRLFSVATTSWEPSAAAAWSPDSQCFAAAVGSLGGVVRVYCAATGQVRFTWRGQYDGVRSMAWSPDGRLVATGVYDGPIMVWQPVL